MDSTLFHVPFQVTYQAHIKHEKTNIAYLQSIFGHVGIQQMVRSASENNEIPEINRWDFNSYQCTPYIGSATKRAPDPWTIL